MTDVTNTASGSRGRAIIYWITTILVALAMGTGAADVLRIPAVIEGMTQLGYPVYFCVILGVWKMLGAVVLLAPRTPRLKEWAYAGTVFDLTGPAASHFAVGDDAGKLAAPIVLTVLTLVSWKLRPASRRLGDMCSKH